MSDTPMTTLRRKVGQCVRRMTPEQAKAWLARYNAEYVGAGATMFHESVRDLTGGFNSQSINTYVIRKVFDRSKEAA
jgi:hypothetical protein